MMNWVTDDYEIHEFRANGWWGGGARDIVSRKKRPQFKATNRPSCI